MILYNGQWNMNNNNITIGNSKAKGTKTKNQQLEAFRTTSWNTADDANHDSIRHLLGAIYGKLIQVVLAKGTNFVGCSAV